MPAGERREYAGNAPPRTLSSGIDNAATAIAISDGTGWPTGAVGPFFVVIDKGLTSEEKVKCSSRTANSLTVAASGRGMDGTAAASHSAGATIEHVITALDMDNANQHYADTTIDQHTQYLNTGRHDLPARHGLANLDMAALTASLIPSGVMWEFGGAAAPAGWLLCDGSAVSRATFAALFTAIGTTFGVGDGTTTFNLPDARSRSTVGASTQNAVAGGVVANVALGGGLTARARAAAFGAETNTLTTANLAAHGHNHSHSGTTADQDRNHQHSLEAHQHWVNGVGDHRHGVGGSGAGAPDILWRWTGSGEGLQQGSAGMRATGTSMDWAGGHDHGWSGGFGLTGGWQSANTGHLHGFSTSGDNTQTGSASAFTILNPALTVHKIIKT